MRENKTKTTFIKSPEEFFRYMTGDDYVVHSFDLFSDEIVMLTHTQHEDFLTTSTKYVPTVSYGWVIFCMSKLSALRLGQTLSAAL